MIQNKAFKYRFYPSVSQQTQLSQTFGCVRVVWNQLLNFRSSEYKLNGNKINYNKASAKLTELKQDPKFKCLNDVSSVALQQTLRNQEQAFINFFKKQAKYPKIKKRKSKQSFKLVDTGFRMKDGKVYIAKCEEPLNLQDKGYNDLPTTVSSITISKDSANRYFASFCCEVDIEVKPVVEKTVGVDLGLTDFGISSDGEKFKPLKALLEYHSKLARAQRWQAKKVKGSKNRNKARIKVARIHNKIADSRKDYLHQLSTKLINENQVICLEDLNVAGMIKNHHLAKHIADASWSEFVRQVEYKANWYGRTISKVSPWYPSSQICSDCGHQDGKKPLTIRQWDCYACGVTHDRDVNAAKNIHTAGLAELQVCGVSGTG